MIDPDRPAVPTEQDDDDLRDYFAAHALTGLLASAESGDFGRRAYALADEMIAARKGTPTGEKT